MPACSTAGTIYLMAPRVLNAHRDGTTPSTVFIGRGSKWGNDVASHLAHTKAAQLVATREESIRLWWQAFRESELMDQLDELAGFDLMCFCAPRPCHGDILLRLANATDRATEALRIDGEQQPPLTLFG